MQRGGSQGSCKRGAGPWEAGSRSQGCSWAHAVTPAKPSVARDLQGSPRARCRTSTWATQPAAGELLPCSGRQRGEILPGHPDLPECCTRPPFLRLPMAPGSKKSFPSLARSPRHLAFKMSRKTYITVSKKCVAGQTPFAGATQGVDDGYIPALEAINLFTAGYNSTVMCFSLLVIFQGG